jgi:hypothetical protein
MPTNQISVEITQEKDTVVNQILDKLTAEFDFMVALTVEDRRKLAKMGRKNLDIVERSYQYAEANPKYLPAYMPFEEFKKDVLLYQWLRKVEKRLDQFFKNLRDTAITAEAEAYRTARLYYHAVKSEANVGDEVAEHITTDLAIHFKKKGKKKNDNTPKTPEVPPAAGK